MSVMCNVYEDCVDSMDPDMKQHHKLIHSIPRDNDSLTHIVMIFHCGTPVFHCKSAIVLLLLSLRHITRLAVCSATSTSPTTQHHLRAPLTTNTSS